MGGCCCCPSRRQLNEPPVYYYCPQDLERHGSLSSATDSGLSTGLLVDANPDTYQAPPPPLPYDVDFGHPRTFSGILENTGNKIGPMHAANSHSIGEAMSGSGYKSPVTCEDLKELDCKDKHASLPGSPKMLEVEPSKMNESIVSVTNEEDVCPTCFEEYDAENPKIITKCDHHFHLSCILEWMERSDTCPICDQEMVFDYSLSVGSL